MKKIKAGPLRWLFKSAPGVALLVIAAGVGVGYAATDDKAGKGKIEKAPRAGVHMALPAPPPGSENLSQEDRKALEEFGSCMRDNAPQPGEGAQPPDPVEGKEAFEAAFETCKAKLTDSQRQKFERHHAKEEEFRTCMDENGAPKPPAPSADSEAPKHPSSTEMKALQKALKACGEELPSGSHGFVGPSGGPGAPDVLIGPGGPPHGRDFVIPAPGPDGHPGPPPFGPPPGDRDGGGSKG